MAVFRSVHIDIHDSVIARFTMPGGSVFKFVHTVVRDGADVARAIAPRRTGELAASIEGKRPGMNRRFGCTARLWAHAHYAKYVHDGTIGPIYAKHSPILVLAPWGRYGTVRTVSVAGQRPQPFLEEALGAAYVRHNLF